MRKPKFKKIDEKKYVRPELKCGYANQTLHIDIMKIPGRKIEIEPVTEQMKKIFTGGKGFDLFLMWNKIPGKIEWNYTTNTLCVAPGPLGGFTTCPGAGKSIVTAISPLTGSVMDSNVGGHFGPFLKFAGFDALSIQGKSSKNVIIFIDGITETIQIFEATGLPKDAYQTSDVLTQHFGEGKPRSISVITAGPGAKHTRMGCLNFSWYDFKRQRVRYKQAGRGGMGTVFADKGLRAIVIRWDASRLNENNPADAKALADFTRQHTRELVALDPKQNEMAIVGTTHLVTIMNDYGLIPVKNFQYGSHPEVPKLGAEVYRKMFDKGYDGCWTGCALACAHGIKNFVPKTGPYKEKEVFVDGPEYETIAGCGSNCGIFDPHTVAEINFYCDAYGIDTISFGTSVGFAMECFERGLITKTHTKGMELRFGNWEASLKLLHQMARGRGFGVVVGQGIRQMKKIFTRLYGADPVLMQDIGMEAKGLEFSEYISKESLAQQGGYGLALKGPQHDEAWLIFEDAVRGNLPTFEDKAEALWWFPMWRTWFGLMGLCKLPWNDVIPTDNIENPQTPITLPSARAKIPGHVWMYAQYYSALTGTAVAPEDLLLMSERVYNFQRLFNLKMGFGRREHDNIPYRAMGPVTAEEYASKAEYYDQQLIEKHGVDIVGKTIEEKIAILRQFREAEYEKLKDAVYKRRGWTNDGIPTLATVGRLGIDFPDLVELLYHHGVTECRMIKVIYGSEEENVQWHNGMTVEELITTYKYSNCSYVRIKLGPNDYKYITWFNFKTTVIPDGAEVFIVPLIAGG